MAMQRRPINIDRAAWFLIRRYGEDSAMEAFRRAQSCADRRDQNAAHEWRLVLNKVIELHFAKPKGRIN